MSSTEKDKETDDVAGAAEAAGAEQDEASDVPPGDEEEEIPPDPDATADAPKEVAELASACVRFIRSRYGLTLDYRPDTLSLLDQWVREAREEAERRTELVELVQSAAGAYLGEVVRRDLGGRWATAQDYVNWRLCLSTVYCAFNPIGMVREALLLEPAEGWHAHFELDPAEREPVEARLDALPPVPDDEYYAPSTRFDVVSIVFHALRERLRAQGMADVRFTLEDYSS
jgi:hypothetical protein